MSVNKIYLIGAYINKNLIEENLEKFTSNYGEEMETGYNIGYAIALQDIAGIIGNFCPKRWHPENWLEMKHSLEEFKCQK